MSRLCTLASHDKPAVAAAQGLHANSVIHMGRLYLASHRSSTGSSARAQPHASEQGSGYMY